MKDLFANSSRRPRAGSRAALAALGVVKARVIAGVRAGVIAGVSSGVIAGVTIGLTAGLSAGPALAQEQPTEEKAAATPQQAPPPQTPPPSVTAGYDKGFFIKADRFEMHIGTRIQLLYQRTDLDTFLYDSLLKDTQNTQALNDFFIRRFKLYFAGFAWNPALKYKIQFDILPFKVGGAGAGGNVRLEEAFVDVTYKPWTQVRFGQFKVPWSYEKMTSSGKLNLVDRSIVNAFFGVNQEPGVSLYGLSFEKKFRYDVSVTQGVSDLLGYNVINDTAANGASNFRYIGRVTWEPLSPYVMEEGAVASPQDPQLTLQLGLQSNQTTIPQDADPFMPKDAILPFGPSDLGAPSPTFTPEVTASIARWAGVSQSRKPYNRNEMELLGAYKYKQFYIEGQYIYSKVEPDLAWLDGKNNALKDLSFPSEGYRLQTGLMLIPTKLELAGRWAQVTRNAEAQFYDNPTVKEKIVVTEYRVGVNWYLHQHDWKWQFDLGWIDTTKWLNGTKLVVPIAADNPDKLIQNNTREDFVFRTQVQFQF